MPVYYDHSFTALLVNRNCTYYSAFSVKQNNLNYERQLQLIMIYCVSLLYDAFVVYVYVYANSACSPLVPHHDGTACPSL